MEGVQRLILIKNQLKQIQSNPPTRWKIIQINQSNWDCWITCDNSCPFYGIPFLLKVQFPQEYPNKRPVFTLPEYKKFFHPNILPADGSICHKTLNNDNFVRVRERIQGFVNLLSVPNPSSALNGVAAQMYDSDPRKYYRTALNIFRGQKE